MKEKKWFEKDKDLRCDYRQQKRFRMTELTFKEWLKVRGYK